MSGPVETARAAWGETMPDWVAELAKACEDTSQNQVAQRLKRSAALVSHVLRRKYAGDMAAVEDLVRGVFMAGCVECPALGTLPVNECREHRRMSRRFSNTNELRVRMYRACHRCPRNTEADDAGE